jgi:phosphoribosyl-ATP pyrophosphohydrolase
VYEDGSEDEVEDVRHFRPKQNNNPYNHESYTNLVYQSASDKLKEKVQDERNIELVV